MCFRLLCLYFVYIDVRSARLYFPICWTRGLRCEGQRAKCLALSRWMLGMSGILRVSCKWEGGVRMTTGHLQIQTFLVAVSYVLLCFHASSYCRVVVTTNASYTGTLGCDCRPQEKPSLLNFTWFFSIVALRCLLKQASVVFITYRPQLVFLSFLSLSLSLSLSLYTFFFLPSRIRR